jgi:hypothetical protein
MSKKQRNDNEKRSVAIIQSFIMQPSSSPGSFSAPIAFAFSDPCREMRRPLLSEEEEVARLEALVQAQRMRRERRILPRLLKRLFRYPREAPMAAR